MRKLNKQTKTLIAWAKKYMDCDTELETTIEEIKVLIKTEVVFNQIHMLIEINGKPLEYYFYFENDGNSWKKCEVQK